MCRAVRLPLPALADEAAVALEAVAVQERRENEEEEEGDLSRFAALVARHGLCVDKAWFQHYRKAVDACVRDAARNARAAREGDLAQLAGPAPQVHGGGASAGSGVDGPAKPEAVAGGGDAATPGTLVLPEGSPTAPLLCRHGAVSVSRSPTGLLRDVAAVSPALWQHIVARYPGSRPVPAAWASACCACEREGAEAEAEAQKDRRERDAEKKVLSTFSRRHYGYAPPPTTTSPVTPPAVQSPPVCARPHACPHSPRDLCPRAPKRSAATGLVEGTYFLVPRPFAAAWRLYALGEGPRPASVETAALRAEGGTCLTAPQHLLRFLQGHASAVVDNPEHPPGTRPRADGGTRAAPSSPSVRPSPELNEASACEVVTEEEWRHIVRLYGEPADGSFKFRYGPLSDVAPHAVEPVAAAKAAAAEREGEGASASDARAEAALRAGVVVCELGAGAFEVGAVFDPPLDSGAELARRHAARKEAAEFRHAPVRVRRLPAGVPPSAAPRGTSRSGRVSRRSTRSASEAVVCSGDDTLRELRRKMMEQFELPLDHFVRVFCGSELLIGETTPLRELGVRTDSTLFLQTMRTLDEDSAEGAIRLQDVFLASEGDGAPSEGAVGFSNSALVRGVSLGAEPANEPAA